MSLLNLASHLQTIGEAVTSVAARLQAIVDEAAAALGGGAQPVPVMAT